MKAIVTDIVDDLRALAKQARRDHVMISAYESDTVLLPAAKEIERLRALEAELAGLCDALDEANERIGSLESEIESVIAKAKGQS